MGWIYGGLGIAVLWLYPGAILFNFVSAGIKEKLLYIFSPEKYFMLVLGRKGNRFFTVEFMRCLWLLTTYIFDWAAVLALVFAQAPMPLALQLIVVAVGGITVDILGAIYGNWGGVEVPTVAGGHSDCALSTVLMSIIFGGDIMTVMLEHGHPDWSHWFSCCAETDSCCGDGPGHSCCCSEAPKGYFCNCFCDLCECDCDCAQWD